VQVKSEEHRKTFTAGLTSFINEARMLAKFSHPGLVEVFRFWEANGTAYMAMRYYRGVTLRETLRTSRQQITEQWLCETLDPILLALKELHNERCFHRDIAPDNILVLPNGKSVLMDFGAARRIISGMTQALTTVLKPGYAPIEQYYDDGSMPQGAWTDIYAVGGLLYHLMTGKVPVQAISRMMSDPLKPVADIIVEGAFSQRLCNVVMKCLAVLPENRYQNVDELRAALGWITTPVVSTVMHAPMTTAAAEPDFQATMIMDAASPERRALTELAAAIKAGQEQTPAKVADMPRFDPDATLVTSRVHPASPVQVASIDDLINSAASPVPGGVPVATGTKTDPQPKVREVKPPKAPDTKPLVLAKKPPAVLWLAMTAVLLVLVGAAVFFSGVLNQSTPESTVAASAQAPSTSPPPAAPAEVAPPIAATLPASEAVMVPAPVAAVETPVEAVAPQLSLASSVALPAAAPASAMAAPKTGVVRIEVIGGWGNVLVDGQPRGTVPPVLAINLPPGSHDIEIQNPAVPSARRKVTVIAGKTVVVRHAFPR
jgi:non-specific serine/threonine protein kinase